MNDVVTTVSGAPPLWVSLISLLQLLLVLWLGALALFASWKAFRWLIKWKP